MSSVVISGDTSGAITLQAPAVSGNTTLTLPTTSGTVVVANGAQTIEFADGSASAPSITNTGDTNTGMFFPAADTIAFAEGGVETMRLDSSGNVGIGTTTTNARVYISSLGGWSTSNWGRQLFITTPTNSSNPCIGISDASGGNNWAIGNAGGGLSFSQMPAITDSSGSQVERMRINSSGIVTMPFQPAFLATGSASNTTYTASSVIVFGTLASTFVSSNRSSGYNTSTSTYTAPVAGLYQFYAQFYTSSNPTSIAWWKNGSQMSWLDAALVTFNTTGVNNLVNGSAIIELAAGDTINVRVRTGNGNVIIYGGHSAFWGYLIG